MTQNNDLIVFEENLTAEGLKKIAEEAENFPTIAETKEDYNLVLEQHKRFKRLHVAVRGRADELIKIKKTDFQLAKTKISNDLNIVLGIIEPIRDNLALARENWDDKIKAAKAEAAAIEAKRQQEEIERQQKIQAEFDAYEENRLFDQRKEQEKKDAELKAQQEKLDREKYEFECEKSRLSFDDAWDLVHGNGPGLLGPEFDGVVITDKALKKGLSTVEEESAKHEVEKLSRLVKDGEVFERLNEDGTKEFIDPENVVGAHESKIIVKNKAGKDKLKEHGVESEIDPSCFETDDLPIAPDLQKVADKMDRQEDRLFTLKKKSSTLSRLIAEELETGFESQKITDHLYTFNQQLTNFIDQFPEFNKKD